ncbi:glycosyltransferase family 10 [Candidatus Haliotispira prima]|uniref:Glycosyltransferase family 10 n=1 Tax=Candidatus Haliotispira prima TaxID=3034016 RepID=A0ABY8MGE2_9SPIO|nr:glycosyltransferase family 10 [Candidatus Haliotispira prima]
MVKKKLRLAFSDMWADFEPSSNVFTRILEERFEIILSDAPDLLIYSTFGKKHKTYNCHKLFFSGENSQTDFTECDFGISSEYLSRSDHYRMPFGIFWLFERYAVDELFKEFNLSEVRKLIEGKQGACAIVVSNGGGKERNDFLSKLQLRIPVVSGGRFQNNIGSFVEDKMTFISNYIFNLCFENSSTQGYLTEKIIDAIYAKTIPIYWGDPTVGEFFNLERMLYFDGKDEAGFIGKIVTLAEDKEALARMFCKPILNSKANLELLDKERFYHFIYDCAEMSIINRKGDRIILQKKVREFIREIKRKAKA